MYIWNPWENWWMVDELVVREVIMMTRQAWNERQLWLIVDLCALLYSRAEQI